MNDYYECNYCKFRQDEYSRFCPSCDSEKSMHVVEDGKIIDMLVRIVNTTSSLLYVNCRAASGANVASRDELITWLKNY